MIALRACLLVATSTCFLANSRFPKIVLQRNFQNVMQFGPPPALAARRLKSLERLPAGEVPSPSSLAAALRDLDIDTFFGRILFNRFPTYPPPLPPLPADRPCDCPCSKPPNLCSVDANNAPLALQHWLPDGVILHQECWEEKTPFEVLRELRQYVSFVCMLWWKDCARV
jgi:hypothetical protein